MNPEDLEDGETPTIHVLTGFCLFMSILSRADEDGKTEIPAENEDEEAKVVAQWANEYLAANKPLTAEECEILRDIAVKCELSEPEISGMMSLAEDGFGIRDIRMISLNAPIEPNYPLDS